jgi:hypothetical protein
MFAFREKSYCAYVPYVLTLKTKKPACAGSSSIVFRLLQFELDTLCQWKAVRIVDRVGLSAHVDFPCIRT